MGEQRTSRMVENTVWSVYWTRVAGAHKACSALMRTLKFEHVRNTFNSSVNALATPVDNDKTVILHERSRRKKNQMQRLKEYQDTAKRWRGRGMHSTAF
jgi:hypothetical protein